MTKSDFQITILLKTGFSKEEKHSMLSIFSKSSFTSELQEYIKYDIPTGGFRPKSLC